MKRVSAHSGKLIAPCGMNCAVCSRYLSYLNDLKRSQCGGCRLENKKCSYLFEKCSGLNSSINETASAKFCFQCDQYPCKQINRMDDRYRKNYKMSVKNNLENIRKKGIDKFIEEQYEEHSCSQCDGFKSVHNGQCFSCDGITRLLERHSK
ncbi:MAG: DUF3795 domain-containing protein [Desulfobacterales bacterium]|nr:DUF3795 domain-containing protein [Desulfobacterales bacterium]